MIGRVTGAHRGATMSTLRVAFLSALVLELSAAVATALVAVEVGLRLLYGHMGYETALLVLLLTPEAYLPLRAVGAQFHASMEGAAAADGSSNLDIPPAGPPRPPGRSRASWGRADLRAEEIRLDGVTVAYPGGRQPALDEVSLAIRPGERIVLTGPSGAGKSSLLALLLRFIAPPRGRSRSAVPIWPSSNSGRGGPRSPGCRSARTCSRAVSRATSPWASPARARAIPRAAELAGAAEFIEALAGRV